MIDDFDFVDEMVEPILCPCGKWVELESAEKVLDEMLCEDCYAGTQEAIDGR